MHLLVNQLQLPPTVVARVNILTTVALHAYLVKKVLIRLLQAISNVRNAQQTTLDAEVRVLASA
mgnify:CR=1 FL=1